MGRGVTRGLALCLALGNDWQWSERGDSRSSTEMEQGVGGGDTRSGTGMGQVGDTRGSTRMGQVQMTPGLAPSARCPLHQTNKQPHHRAEFSTFMAPGPHRA